MKKLYSKLGCCKNLHLVTMPKASVCYRGEPVVPHKLHCSNPIFSFWLMAVFCGASINSIVAIWNYVGPHLPFIFQMRCNVMPISWSPRFLTFYTLYHSEDKVGFLSRKMLIFPWYCYWNRWNVWVSSSVLFGRHFVPVASLKALYSWRLLDCTRLGLCWSSSLLYIHLLAIDESARSIVHLFLKRVNECFWYPLMTFILAFLVLWLKLLPLFSNIPDLSLCTWFQVTMKLNEKECKYLSTNVFFCFQKWGNSLPICS